MNTGPDSVSASKESEEHDHGSPSSFSDQLPMAMDEVAVSVSVSPSKKPIRSISLENLQIATKKKRRRRTASTTIIKTTPGEFRQKVQEFTGGQTRFAANEVFPPTENLFPFISHCSLFLSGYEFTKEELIMLWIAEGLVPMVHSGTLEHAANEKFNSLVSKHIIIPSRFDKSVDFSNPKVKKLLYKVKESMVSSFKPAFSNVQYATISDGKYDKVSEIVVHLSIQCKSMDNRALMAVKKLKYLRTLFFIPSVGISVERIPHDLFLWFKHLRTLNLCRSLVSELPVSIGNLKSLRYIDLSYTPIKHLPDTIDNLHHLKTLKLNCCLNLVGLPKGMRKLTSLRHLELDVMRQLNSMPSGMGNLTNLQTLSAFLVGKNEGSQIGELRNTINLTGSFCISRLENVSNFEEAREAELINKKFLNKLELRWTDMRDGNAVEEEKILEHLTPPLGLEELRILYYGGSKLPDWISDPSYSCLVDITLYNCKSCHFLPPIGELPSLQFLHIREMNELRRIDHRFCRKNSDQQFPAFPRLEELTIEFMPNLEEWIGVQNGDYPSLQKLKVECCSKLISLPLLPCLHSLKHLELTYCPNILSLPDQDIVASLEFLLIKDCPELKKRCLKGEGQDWGKIAHVPKILIDDDEIS